MASLIDFDDLTPEAAAKPGGSLIDFSDLIPAQSPPLNPSKGEIVGGMIDQALTGSSAPASDAYGTKRAVKDLVGAVGAAGQGLKQGLSFGFADELQSALAAGIASAQSPDLTYKDAFSQAMDIYKNKRENAAQEYPTAYYPTELLGGVATGSSAAQKLGGITLAKGFTQAPIKTAVGTGALSGAVYGAGTGEGDVQERLKQSAISGGVGGAAGGIGGYLAPKIGAGIERVFTRKPSITQPSEVAPLEQYISEAESRAISPTTTPVSGEKALEKVAGAIQKDFPDNWEQVLQAWKQGDKTLAELYGSRVTTLAKGAAQFPSGKASAERYFTQNIKEAPDRIKFAINDNISGIENYHATADDLLTAGKAAAMPKYERAFSIGNINSSRINEFLAQPELQTGIQKGLKIQRLESVAEGKPFNPQDYAITGFNEAGDPVIGRVPNMRLLDAGKRGLDAMIGEQTDAVTGKVTELGRALIKTKEGYVNELKNANPFYKEALDSAGDYFKINNAMKSGRDFMTLDSEQVSRSFSKLQDNEKLAYKIGVGKELRDIIDNTPIGANPYNRVFGKLEQQKRLASILSPSEYKNLEQALKSEDRLFKMRNEVLGGSPTASKLEAMNQITSDAQELLQSLPTGGTKATLMGGAKGVLKKVFGGLNDNSAEAVSRLLYETNPTKKVLLIDKMMGDNTLTNAEKLLIKDSYFKAENYFKPKLQGAIGSSILSNEGNKGNNQ